MKKIVFSLLLVLFSNLSYAQEFDEWDGSASEWTRGEGTQISPYLIETSAQLAQLAVNVNNGNSYKDAYFQLTANLNLSGSVNDLVRHQWTPIGGLINKFQGHFDGDHFQIKNMYVNRPDGMYNGLFGNVSEGSICNLSIVGESVVVGNGYTGGFVGRATSSTLKNLSNEGTIKASGSYCGGITGMMDAPDKSSIMENCANSGAINSATTSANIGGIVGRIGISNKGEAILINCYNTGEVTGRASIGGVVGNAYSPKSATGSLKIANCYTTGTVIGDGGGSIGAASDAPNITITNSFYLKDSGYTNGKGEEKTEEEMKATAFVNILNGESTPAAWIADTNNINNGFPILEWQNTVESYTITTTVAGETGGNVNGGGTYPKGTEIELVAIATQGYEFSKWEDGNKDNPRTIKVEADATYTAIFIPLEPFSSWDGSTEEWTKGRGVENDPYLIESAAQLAQLAVETNNGTTFSNKYFKLMINIDLNGAPSNNPRREWIPIGLDKSKFGGNFDGNNKKIKNVYINQTVNNVGLFGFTMGTISNLGITGESSITGSTQTGGVAGYADGIIINCYNEANVSGESSVGGIAGIASSTSGIINCYNEGNITGTFTYSYQIAGIAGYLNSVAKYCYNKGTVTGANKTGGIAGSGTIITNSYNVGTIIFSGTGIYPPNDIGALSGTIHKDINNYFLAGSGPDNKIGTSKTDAEMKSDEFIISLNGQSKQWFKDRKNINSNYPVFAQQSVKLESWWDSSSTGFAAGDGSENNPYHISNAGELAFLSKSVNEGNTFSGNYFVLDNDIDLKGTTEAEAIKVWIPIGKDRVNGFSGIFDGNGHVIQNMYVSTNSYGGLFGYGKNAKIANLGIENNCYVNGIISVGGVIGRALLSDILNCFNNGTVDGCGNTGGVAGENSATLINCFNAGSINGFGNTGGVTGVAFATATVANCYNKGNIEGQGYTGGVAGVATSVTNLYNMGLSSGAGIIGKMYNATMSNCYNAAKCDGNALVEDASNTTVTNCYYLSGSGKEDKNGQKKTTTEIKSEEFVTELNGDSTLELWMVDTTPNINKGVPVLKWQTMANWQTLFKVTATGNEGGTVTGSGSYAFGTKVTLEAKANSEYEFTQWEDGSKENPRLVDVDSDAAYIATFTKLTNIENALSDKISIYPIDREIHISSKEPKDVTIHIYDASGKLINHIPMSGTYKRVHINNPGLYIIICEGNKYKINIM